MRLADERIHSVIVLLVIVVALACLFLAKQIQSLAGLLLISFVFLFYAGLKVKWFFRLLPKILLFSSTYFVLLILFSKQESVFPAAFVSTRIFATALISICGMQVISHEICILFLCQKKVLSPKLAYPLLFALSSIFLLKKQFDLIRINSRLRRIRGWVWPHLLFQFIVFSIRFSEKGSISLMTRHLSAEKYFYYDFSLRPKDILSSVIVSCLLCTMLAVSF